MKLLMSGMVTVSVIALAFSIFSTGVHGQAKVSTQGQPVTAAEFDRIFRQNNNGGRWGKEDALGTINLMTDAKRKQTAALAKMGITVSVAHDLSTEESPDDPAGRFKQELAPWMRKRDVALAGATCRWKLKPPRPLSKDSLPRYTRFVSSDSACRSSTTLTLKC